MKKLFVSVPMQGRTEENIRNTINKLHHVAETIVGEELELLDTYHPEFPNFEEGVNPGIFYLSKSIEKLATADYLISTDYGWEYAGVQIERDIARQYGVEILALIPCEHVAPDIIEAERERMKECVGELRPVTALH